MALQASTPPEVFHVFGLALQASRGTFFLLTTAVVTLFILHNVGASSQWCLCSHSIVSFSREAHPVCSGTPSALCSVLPHRTVSARGPHGSCSLPERADALLHGSLRGACLRAPGAPPHRGLGTQSSSAGLCGGDTVSPWLVSPVKPIAQLHQFPHKGKASPERW